jgi:two-component system chemotaxis response regulator CheY
MPNVAVVTADVARGRPRSEQETDLSVLLRLVWARLTLPSARRIVACNSYPGFFLTHEETYSMGTRVLVADDSSTMRKIILRSLQAVGVTEATEAADGAEAVATFKPGQFDLVLTDWNMPGKTGLEVVQEIRVQDANVPIIMVTTEAEKGRVMQAIQAGVSDYLVKPFTADTLREKLQKHGC